MHELQSFDEAHLAALLLRLGRLLFLQPCVEEGEIISAVLQYACDQMLAQAFGEIHVALQVHEGGLGFDHPELREVARGIAVLRAEGGAEGVDLAQGQCREFRLQLSAYGEARFATEEVLLEVHLTCVGQRWLLRVEHAHAEHLTRPLGIAGGDDGRVEVVVAKPIEILVDAEAHLVSHAEHRTVRVGAEPQMRLLPEEFQRVLLRLDRIGGGIAVAEHGHFVHLHLHALAAAL